MCERSVVLDWREAMLWRDRAETATPRMCFVDCLDSVTGQCAEVRDKRLIHLMIADHEHGPVGEESVELLDATAR